MMMLPVIPANRAQLFEGFIRLLYEREQQAREQRTDAASVPPFESWHAAMVGLAEALQRVDGEQGDDGARTSLGRNCWPSSLQADPRLIDFGIDASVLQRSGDELRFTHQLLQESLASHVMLQASRTGKRAASDFWPTARWWQRSGWEVVAEIAAEACGDADGDLHLLLDWLAAVNPEVAALAWQRAGAPTLPEHLSQAWADQWMPRMTDIVAEPDPAARAAIGRALGTFDLDRRPGIGLGVDGMPDIDWVTIADHGPFAYQRGQHDEKSVRVPAFKISRYPVTNRQFQAFINAGGYLDKRWWQGLAQHIDEPMASAWQEPNAPRECVSWFEAVAFCRWLSAVISAPVTLPTEMQWERAAAGPAAHTYPWSRAGGGEGYQSGLANIDETSDKTGPHYLGRTSAVGIYPGGGSIEGVLDLAGNVWEWCLNDDETPENTGLSGDARRAVRGGSWYYHSGYCRAACRYWFTPEFRYYYLGFRVVCCPIQEP
jgi:formylglycine-generating enzyme required for sulfatase activity